MMKAIKRSPKLPATYPGLTFKKKILERNNITVSAAAEKMKITRAHLSRFVNGKVAVTGDFAVKLEKACGVSAGFWLNQQNDYDLYKSHQKEIDCEPLYPFKKAANA
jgi:addiction module HigA family antidote